MSFAYPWIFVLLPMVVVLRIYLARKKGQRTPALIVTPPAFLKLKLRSKTEGRLAQAIELIGFLLLLIAAARPQTMDAKIQRSAFGIDIVVAMDLSQSMYIEDFQPNRITVAKKMVGEFFKLRSSDRVGLVVFSGDAYTASPLTTDTEMLIKSLDRANPEDLKAGTAIGVAIATAINRLDGIDSKSKVIILATDGDNNAGSIDPATAAQIAADKGIKIYTIAIGTEGTVRLPVLGSDSFGRQYKRYELVNSSFDYAALERISSLTGGKSFVAQDPRALERVFTEIDQLEKTKVEINKFVRYEEHFWKWAIAGLWLLALGAGIRLLAGRAIP